MVFEPLGIYDEDGDAENEEDHHIQELDEQNSTPRLDAVSSIIVEGFGQSVFVDIKTRFFSTKKHRDELCEND